MNPELKKIISENVTLENFFVLIKAILATATTFITIVVLLFTVLMVSDQFGIERKNFIKDFGSTSSPDSVYLCSVGGKKLCTLNELITEGIMMDKLVIKNYFYFSYIPDKSMGNLMLMFLNAILVSKFFIKIKNKKIRV